MSEKTNSSWVKIKNILQEELPKSSFETWFGGLEAKKSPNGKLLLSAPSGFVKRGIEEQYMPMLKNLLKDYGEESSEISIKVEEEREAKEDSSGSSRLIKTPDQDRSKEGSEARESPSNKIPLNKEYTFENFVQSKSNQLAHAASRAVSESPAEAYNPLFIYANVGLGKTHLLHAIGNHLRNKLEGAKIIYTSAERFAIEMIQAIRKNNTEEFRQKYRNVEGFLLDDVHFLENKQGTQEELFHTFNELYGNDKQIVLTSDRPPDELSDLQDRLVSRFRWGLVADIQPPNFETRVAILSTKAKQKGIDVDEEILELIASRVSTNVRALEGALIQVVARADLAGGRIASEEVEDFLPKTSKEEKKLTIDKIKETVANHYNLTVSDLEGPSRKKKIAKTRHIAIYLSRELTESSFPTIGKEFGDRDHSTVMHSHNKISKMIDETPLFYEEIKQLEENLLALSK